MSFTSLPMPLQRVIQEIEARQLKHIPTLDPSLATPEFSVYVGLISAAASKAQLFARNGPHRGKLSEADIIALQSTVACLIDVCAHVSVRAAEFIPSAAVVTAEAQAAWVAHIVSELLFESKYSSAEAEQVINCTNSLLLHKNEWVSSGACLIQAKMANALNPSAPRFKSQVSIMLSNFQAVTEKDQKLSFLVAVHSISRLLRLTSSESTSPEVLEWLLNRWGKSDAAQAIITRNLLASREWWLVQSAQNYKTILSYFLKRLSIEEPKRQLPEVWRLLHFFGLPHVVPIVLRSPQFVRSLWNAVLSVHESKRDCQFTMKEARCMLATYLATPACRLTPAQSQEFPPWQDIMKSPQSMRDETWPKLMDLAYGNFQTRLPIAV